MRCRAVSLVMGACALLLSAEPCFGPASTARADGPPAGAEPQPVVAVTTGDLVNLRVGPHVDDHPILQLEEGSVIVIVERAGEWLGVRLPAGFQAAISATLTEPVDAEHVRVTGDDVNLRVRPPEGDRAFAVFRDRVARGTVLPVIVREGDWIWVEAPEEVRAYLNGRYVKEIGPLADHPARVDEARGVRAARERMRLQAVKRGNATEADTALREAVGAVGRGLLELRAAGGYDNAPVAALADRLQAAVDANPAAADRSKALAKVLLDDLEREMLLRTAFSDELLAKKRVGAPLPKAPAAPAPKQDGIQATGFVRWEAAPGWEGGGIFVLRSDLGPTGQVLYALRWASGDLKAFEGVAVKVRGKTAGGRILGAITFDVSAIERVAK